VREGPPGKQLPRATSEVRNGAREIPVVLVDRGDCRHRLSMSALPGESWKDGLDTEARRSGQARTPSFDEAAEASDLVLPQGAHDRERQRLVPDRPVRPKTPSGGSAARRALDQELTGPKGAFPSRMPQGFAGSIEARPKPGARRQARLCPRSHRQARPCPKLLQEPEGSWRAIVEAAVFGERTSESSSWSRMWR